MSATMKFTLGRLGLFLATFLVLTPFPLDILIKLLVAVVVSFALSWFLLRGWRDEMSADLATKLERRKAEKEKLRAALAGEDRAKPGEPDEPASRSA